jgi:hypothetical protein
MVARRGGFIFDFGSFPLDADAFILLRALSWSSLCSAQSLGCGKNKHRRDWPDLAVWTTDVLRFATELPYFMMPNKSLEPTAAPLLGLARLHDSPPRFFGLWLISDPLGGWNAHYDSLLA